MTMEFSSLHNHSHFSLWDGISLPEEIIKIAKEKGLKSVAITDHGSCHAHADFFLAGKKHGVKAILGNEAYVIHDLKEWSDLKDEASMEVDERDTNSREDTSQRKETTRKLFRKGHMVLLARNRVGLANLNRLTFESFKNGFYGKPRMDKKMLADHREGLIATSACMGGVISQKCWDFLAGRSQWEDVVNEAKEFDEIFGRGKFFLEVQFNESQGQRDINSLLYRVHRETGIPLTVATDSHYPVAEGWATQELLYLLRGKKTYATKGDAWNFEVRQLYLKSGDEMWSAYKQFGDDRVPEAAIVSAFENTLLIDSLIDNFEPDTHVRLPTLPYTEPFKEMGQRAIDGLKSLGLADNEVYKAQLLRELKVIKDKGFGNYFLVVQEMIRQAKEEGQFVGAGRGSAAGSLVCYALGITDLDPIEHELMFERFLDPSRADLPDIDCDFEDVDQTKDMLRRMFGDDNVACLSTYNTFQIKGLLKDLGRVYDLDHNVVNKVNKGINAELRALYGAGEDKSSITIKLEDVVRVSPTFNKFAEENPLMAQHIKLLYGRNKSIGRHASGVIVGDDLKSETSIFMAKAKDEDKRVIQTSFTEGIVNKNIGAMGFVKLDILSITTLKILHEALSNVSKRTGQDFETLRENLRPHRLDLDDEKMMKTVFWDGHAGGVFQFSGKGIRRLAAQVHPEKFSDVSAICSLYRPGSLDAGMHKIFIENKKHPDSIEYDNPLFESILKPTYGAMIYQEQLMRVCQVVGKMELKDIQRIRKNLLKKIKGRSEEFLKAENEELSGKFVKGCVENGMSQEKATQWWENIKAWGGYGFNKAHSDTYTVMTMQCAWLATYYPLEFYAATLTKGKAKDLQGYVNDIKKRGIQVLPVDVNNSKVSHVIEGINGDREGIRLSLGSVKGVGDSAAHKIVEHQPYTSFLDFVQRSGVGKTAIEPLIQVGAFGSLEQNMLHLANKYAAFAADPKLKQKKREPEMIALLSSLPAPDAKDVEPVEKIMFEMDLIGFTSRGSPFEVLDRDKKISNLFDGIVSDYSEFIESDEEVGMLPVIVKDVKEKAQRNKQMMAWIKFGTKSGEEFEAPCFSAIWKWISGTVKKGRIYVVTFNRKLEDPEALVLGRPGWAHSQHSAQSYLVNVDEIQMS